MQETRRFVLYLWRLPYKSRQFAQFYNNWHRCHMWVEFVAGSLPCSERFFFAYSGFPLSSKNQQFQIPIQSGMHWHISMSSQELLSASRVNKLHFFFITILQFTVSWKFNISQKFIWVQSDFCAYNLPKK